MTEPTKSYEERLMTEPVTASERASHSHALTELIAMKHPFETLRRYHAEKFTDEEMEVLRAAAEILARKEVPMLLVSTKPETSPVRRPGISGR